MSINAQHAQEGAEVKKDAEAGPTRQPPSQPKPQLVGAMAAKESQLAFCMCKLFKSASCVHPP